MPSVILYSSFLSIIIGRLLYKEVFAEIISGMRRLGHNTVDGRNPAPVDIVMNCI